jgi:hypothetical protein
VGLWSLSLSLRLQSKQSKFDWVDASDRCPGQSFAEVLQVKPCSEVVFRGLEGWSSHCMDLFQVAMRSKVGNGEFVHRLAVDCFDLEKHSLPAAGSAKKMRGIKWVEHFLEFFIQNWAGFFLDFLKAF